MRGGSRRRPLAACGLVALAAASCRGFAQPRDETLRRLAPMAVAERLPSRFVVDLEGPGLSGTFDGLLAVASDRLRLQLFPDVGGKVLDLEVRAAAIEASLAGERYVARPPLDAAEPHVALALAMVFAELIAPVGPGRVLGERTAGDAVQVLLRPALGEGDVTATLAPDGRVARYDLVLGALALSFAADGSLRARGLRAQFDWGGAARR